MPELKNTGIKEQFDLVTLKSGHKSLRLSNTQQTFHPGIGPLAEANILYVQQQNLVERCSKPGTFVIWDVGFGASANAISAIEALKNSVAEVKLYSFERTLDPIQFAVEHAEELGYLVPHLDPLRLLLSEKRVKLTERLEWNLIMGDFRKEMESLKIPSPHAIFYDPYSQTVNPELWTLDFFTTLRNRLVDDRPCLLSNYTRSTQMRITWLMAGFFVGVGETIGEKEETTIASNRLELLSKPLDQHWLEKVKRSQNASPFRGPESMHQPISESDWDRLLAHPQFGR